jgi:hypothetical protein
LGTSVIVMACGVTLGSMMLVSKCGGGGEG